MVNSTQELFPRCYIEEKHIKLHGCRLAFHYQERLLCFSQLRVTHSLKVKACLRNWRLHWLWDQLKKSWRDLITIN